MSEETKEFLKTPRGKACIKLGIYVIFFIIVAIYFRTSIANPTNSGTANTPKKEALEVYKDMTNYEYTYLYNDVNIEGKVYRNVMYFEYDGNSYYVDDNIYMIDEENHLVPTTLDKTYYFSNKDIMNFISKGEVIGKNDDYQNGIISKKYSIDIKDLEIENLAEMYITTNEKNDTIISVNIDLNFNNVDGEEYLTNSIKIDYMNINEVSNFTVNYVKE